MEKTPFVRSHRARVKAANKFIENNVMEDISLADREAYVEFFLLEDIIRLYESRLQKATGRKNETRQGMLSNASNIEKFNAIIHIFKALTEVAHSMIDSGDYKQVWKSINEHDLMRHSKRVKDIAKLKDSAIRLLETLNDEAIKASAVLIEMDEQTDDVEAHNANARRVYGLPEIEVQKIIAEVNNAIPQTATKKRKDTILA